MPNVIFQIDDEDAWTRAQRRELTRFPLTVSVAPDGQGYCVNDALGAYLGRLEPELDD